MAYIGTLPQFDEKVQSLTSWMELFEEYCLINKVAAEPAADAQTPNIRRALFLTHIGSKHYNVLHSACLPHRPNKKPISYLVSVLKRKYEPEGLGSVNKYTFHRRVQGPQESGAEYIGALQELAAKCNFGQNVDTACKDQLICGIRSESTRSKLLCMSNLQYEQAKQIFLQDESVSIQLQSMSAAVNKVTSHNTANKQKSSPHRQSQYPSRSSKSFSPGQGPSRPSSSNSGQSTNRGLVQSSPSNRSQECYRCGRHHNPSTCPARQWTCYVGNRQGHTSRKCRNRHYVNELEEQDSDEADFQIDQLVLNNIKVEYSGEESKQVIVVPHSHNDPGWLKTFEKYFELKSKNIINNLVQKLTQYPNMTFVWTEISFLNAWWERSHPAKQKALKKLIKEGRLEITTGGWVMPDEGCSHIYALIDQFIEGHQWVKKKLEIEPKTGWSIDPFGHGPTVPYLLDKSGIEGTIIQRIHYAWKQWLAKRQIEEFYWLPGWSTHKPTLIVHNQPFDIYSIKASCGPHPSVCLSFDFRLIPGEYNEYTAKHEDINEQNLHSKSKILLEEYYRIGSLTPHNVVLVPLGDDFRYEHEIEFDSQYINYMKMFHYINSHSELFNAEVHFGTPFDYFLAVKERHNNIPTLRGDFFVYSDIFSEGKPAYWSGYYTTRPYLKILARQFEHQIRSSEILFTLVSNFIKQLSDRNLIASEKRLEKLYEYLIGARRNLGLFQHHDAITGTSRASVMYDYGTKMFTSIYHCIRLQEAALTTAMVLDYTWHNHDILQSEKEWETYGKPPKKTLITYLDKRKLIIFNPLAEPRIEVVTLKLNTTSVRVYDIRQKIYVPCQISPNLKILEDGKRIVSDDEYDVLFVASLPPLSAVTFILEKHNDKSHHSLLFCNSCNESNKFFVTKAMLPGDIQIENSVLKLLISRNTGFLRQIYRKDLKKKNVVEIQLGAYQSAQRHSGAYLFMPDYDFPEKIIGTQDGWNNPQDDNIVIISGPIATEIRAYYLPLLIHTLRIYNVKDSVLCRGILIENFVDFESPPKNRETELFMRVQTDIQNRDPPEFFTDQNGFQYQKRVKINKLGIEANYYPITTMAWLQDEESRLTLVTNHAQGAAAFEPGRLEVMLDRRMLYDDFRGIGEGVVDNKPITYQNWLLVESMSESTRLKQSKDDGYQNAKARHFNQEATYQLPSQMADYLSRAFNYPVHVYVMDTSEIGDVEVKSHLNFAEGFPSGLHLITLRTITDDILEQFPSPSCYMVLQRPGYSCSVGNAFHIHSTRFSSLSGFAGLKIAELTSVSLTGIKTYETLSSLSDIELEQMEVKTYKIRF